MLSNKKSICCLREFEVAIAVVYDVATVLLSNYRRHCNSTVLGYVVQYSNYKEDSLLSRLSESLSTMQVLSLNIHNVTQDPSNN
jgi:hypothetical protein